MSATVVCPHCGKSIKLRDRNLLGKKGKCPACAQSFLLQESTPEEVVPLELADDGPATGTGAKWVPDAPQPTAAPAPPTVTAAVDSPFAFDFQAAPPATGDTSEAARPMSVRRGRGKSRGWVAMLVTVVIVGVGLLIAWPYLNKPMASVKTNSVASTDEGDDLPAVPAVPGVYTREQLAADSSLIAEFRPTKGEPIPLKYLAGANNIVIHMRPHRIWGPDRSAQEIRECLTTNVKAWLESTIQKITHRQPQQIEELWIGISVVSKVDPPQISTVFRLKDAVPRSTLIEEFNGDIISREGAPLVTRKGDSAFHIGADSRTIAICPAVIGSELSEAISNPGEAVPDGIAELLKSSDRDRTFTLLFEASDVGTYADQLFEPSVKTAMLKLIDWLGNDAETVSWSLHLGQYTHSELRVRPKGSRSTGGKISTPVSLEKEYTQRFPQSVEQDLMGAIRMMHPRRAGFRQILGRFPAMVEAFRQATVLQVSATHLTMTTVLPAKAAPNLVLGTVLAWDESTRTNFNPSVSAMPVAAVEDKLPKTVMERLKIEFEVEFARKPLEEAFLYIADETKVKFIVDGDALKSAGYTKNIPQVFALGKVPGTKAIYTIFTQPRQEQMCLVVDDAKLEALITTHAAAEAKGLKVVPLESLK